MGDSEDIGNMSGDYSWRSRVGESKFRKESMQQDTRDMTR